MHKVEMADFLTEQLGHARFLYCLNFGNAGDALISQASLQLFRRLKLNFETISTLSNTDLQDKIVVYAGGGNLTPQYATARNFILRHQRKLQRLILLPQTISHNEDLLGSLCDNTTVIAREEATYRHVREHARKAQVHLAEEMALHLDVQEALTKQPDLERAAIRHHFRRMLTPGASRFHNKCLRFLLIFGSQKLIWYQALKGLGGMGSVLNAFRTDCEGTSAVLPRDNLDVSRVMAFGCDSEANVYLSANRFLRYLNRFAEIHTNRLHVAIAGGLLGKTVLLHTNSFHKCRSVYEFSLKDRFPKVSFVDSPDGELVEPGQADSRP